MASTKKTKKLNGHLRLRDVSTHTSKRLLASAASVVLCTALGVGLVAALKPPTQDQPASTQTVAQAPSTPPATTIDKKTTLTPTKPTPEKAAPTTPKVQPSEPPTKEDPTPTPTAPTPEPPKEETPKEETPKEPIKEAPPTGQWWTAAKGKRCKVIFPPEHERLVMREGRLNRDETTTYGPFLKNEVVARVRRGNNPEITVHHIGLHPRNGKPSLAHITLHHPNGDKEGILPLQIAGDQITLQPLSGR